MKNLIEKIKLKLEEYGIEIFDHYKLENNDYLFIVQDMLIMCHKKDDISISFQVSTKPEIAANNILLLEEIKQLKNIFIMESFAFDTKGEIMCGDKAYELLEDNIKERISYDIEKSRMYQNILMTTKGYEC